MAALPEDIIDRILATERRLRQLSNAVHSRSGPVSTAARTARIRNAAGSGTPGGAGAAMLLPQDTAVERWPQTSAAAWTTIAECLNPVRQPRMRLRTVTWVSSGAAGEVRVLLNGVAWGDAVTAGAVFDRTGAVAADFGAAAGSLLRIEVQARVTGGTGSVHAQPQLLTGIES